MNKIIKTLSHTLLEGCKLLKHWSSLELAANKNALNKHKQTFMCREMAGFVQRVGFNLLPITDLRGPETKQTN